MLVQVENGVIIKWQLPKVGQLKDGRSVSGYDSLIKSDPILAKEEGWLPLEDNPPEYNPETQYLIDDGYEIFEDKVVKKYKVKDIPEPIEPEPSEMDILNERLDMQDMVIEEILFDIIPNIGGMGGE